MSEKLDISKPISSPTCVVLLFQPHLRGKILGIDRQQRQHHAEAQQVDEHRQENDQQRGFARRVGHQAMRCQWRGATCNVSKSHGDPRPQCILTSPRAGRRAVAITLAAMRPGRWPVVRGGLYDLMHDHHHVRRAAPAGSARSRDALATHQLARLNRSAQGDPAAESLLRRKAGRDHGRAAAIGRRTARARSTSWPSCRSRSRKNCSARAIAGDLAANLTFPLDRYTRFHQTSGTRGRPLVVLDTADDWALVDRLLAIRARRGRSRARTIACSWRFRSGRSSVSGARSTRPARAAAWSCPAAE